MTAISESIKSMESIVGRSYHLWFLVNGVILRVLRSKKSRREMVVRLRRLAGPPTQGEPMCLCNLHSAADQLERGECVYVL